MPDLLAMGLAEEQKKVFEFHHKKSGRRPAPDTTISA
jgi:hypothetical protein